jgi:hypothetical protein
MSTSDLLRPSINATLPPSGGAVEQSEPEAIEAVETPTVETAIEESTTESDLDLDAIIESLPGDEPTSTEPEDVTAKFDTPEFEGFNKQFKETVGVDVKEAYEAFTQIQKQNEELRQQLEQQQAQVTLSTLSSEWGVTTAELDRRVNKVLQLVAEMEKKLPGSSSKYDSYDGIKQLWSHIEKKGAKSAPTTGGGKTEPKSKFKASELRQMMHKDPDKYNQLQSVIAQAWANGEVIDD